MVLCAMGIMLVSLGGRAQQRAITRHTRLPAAQIRAQGSRYVVHLKIAVTDISGRVILQREEWDAVARQSTVLHQVRLLGNPMVLTKFRWTLRNASGVLQEQWWSTDTARVRLTYDAHARHVAIFHAPTTAGSPFWQPVSEFAVSAPDNVGLRSLLFSPRGQALGNATTSGEPVAVIREVGIQHGATVTDTYYLAKATQRLLKEEMVIAPAGKPALTRIFSLQRYDILPPGSVTAGIFDPPLPAGATVTND